MEQQKRIIAVHDISCTGRCSATVALPILSCAGLETSLLPTAVLSTHTAFPGVHSRDLTADLLPTAEHWNALDLTAQAVYIGYLGNVQQTDLLRQVLQFVKGSPRVYIDPVMGDHGKLYRGMDPAFPQVMRQFCGLGHVILPNITEACLMCGEPYREGPHDMQWIRSLLDGLRDLGQEQTVLTGVMPSEDEIGAAVMNCKDGTVEVITAPRLPTSVCGTGDVFASAFIGAQMHGCDTMDSLRLAEEFVGGCIRRTLEQGSDLRRGVNFEAGLGEYIRALQNAKR